MSIQDGANSSRAPEMRMSVACRECGDSLVITKAQLNWATEFSCDSGHAHQLDVVMGELEKGGWNVHDLIRGRGAFREPVANLPLPHGGAFTVGRLDARVDGPDDEGAGRWRLKDVKEARPSEKGFELIE